MLSLRLLLLLLLPLLLLLSATQVLGAQSLWSWDENEASTSGGIAGAGQQLRILTGAKIFAYKKLKLSFFDFAGYSVLPPTVQLVLRAKPIVRGGVRVLIPLRIAASVAVLPKSDFQHFWVRLNVRAASVKFNAARRAACGAVCAGLKLKVSVRRLRLICPTAAAARALAASFFANDARAKKVLAALVFTFTGAAEGIPCGFRLRGSQLRQLRPVTKVKTANNARAALCRNAASPIQLGQCSQTTTANGQQCQLASDGNLQQTASTCSQTTAVAAAKSSWQSQLAEPALFGNIRIFVSLSESATVPQFVIKVDNAVCARYRGRRGFTIRNFRCNAVGSVLKIETTASNQTLTLCEVQAFGQQTAGQLLQSNCRQRTTDGRAQCRRALNGGISQSFTHPCSHTQLESSPWWKADLQQTAAVTGVRIHNRDGCCSNNLRQFVISVDAAECARDTSNVTFAVKDFQCFGVGSSVMIRSLIETYLTLCEVEIFGQLQTRVPDPANQLTLSNCNQSSLSSGGVCGRAIDGSTNQIYSAGSCTHTKPGPDGWWQAELANRSLVTQVRIFNRQDCCTGRLPNFRILIDNSICATHTSADGVFSEKLFNCSLVGQVVRIEKTDANILTLCEVQVFGISVESQPRANAKLTVTGCTQSSILQGGACRLAVDGNTRRRGQPGQSCSQTLAASGVWWQSRLPRRSQVTQIRVYYRRDCCSLQTPRFDIRVGGTVCAGRSANDRLPVGIFSCAARGRRIRIRSLGSAALSLCEVEVWGFTRP